ncbi:hypothetical protein FQA39_LY07306 [Lamprigera yunnana]|nr:hypothetical protein FQA39_LY07306 [Lamprigera yunnana]
MTTKHATMMGTLSSTITVRCTQIETDKAIIGDEQKKVFNNIERENVDSQELTTASAFCSNTEPCKEKSKLSHRRN